MMRTAISPRLAIRIFFNDTIVLGGRTHRSAPTGPVVWADLCVGDRTRCGGRPACRRQDPLLGRPACRRQDPLWGPTCVSATGPVVGADLCVDDRTRCGGRPACRP